MEDNIIVPTNIAYSSCILQNNVEQLKKRYNFLSFGNIGYSVFCRQEEAEQSFQEGWYERYRGDDESDE